MRNWPVHGRAVAIAGAVSWLAGCASAPPRPPVWSETAPSAREALERLAARAESFRTVRAVLDLVWWDDAFGTREECRGSLSWIRPDSLRLRGTSAAFFTVFDLTADARRVRLDVPREHVAVFGDRADPAWNELPLSAEEFLVALLADPCPSGGCGDSVAWLDAEARVLRGPGWTLELEPSTGLPRRWTREPSGTREIRWSEWVIRDRVAWPLRLELVDPSRQERLEIRMGRVDLDRPIPASRFSLELDADREILTPSEAKERWGKRPGRAVFHPE